MRGLIADLIENQKTNRYLQVRRVLTFHLSLPAIQDADKIPKVLALAAA